VELAFVPQLRFGKVHKTAGNLQSLVFTDLLKKLAGVRKDSLARQPIRGSSHHGEQHGATRAFEAGLPGRFGCSQFYSAQIEGRHVLEADVGGEARHAAGVNHRDAGHEPYGKQHTQRHSKIAMNQNRPSAELDHAKDFTATFLAEYSPPTFHDISMSIGRTEGREMVCIPPPLRGGTGQM
jgi:hypothetical protein